MDVVSAGMHDRHITPRIILGVDLARIRQPGFFLDRKRVQLGPQHHSRPASISQDGHNPRAPHMFRNFVAQAAQPLPDLGRGLRFVRREFRMLMQIEIKLVCCGISTIDFLGVRSALSERAARCGPEPEEERQK